MRRQLLHLTLRRWLRLKTRRLMLSSKMQLCTLPFRRGHSLLLPLPAAAL
jgi:hypothetical protein